MKNALSLALFCLFALCAPAQSFADALSSAESHYLKREYAQAYKGYSEAVKAGGIPEARRKEAEYRAAVCLMHIQPGQAALKTTLALVKKYPKTVWEARYLALLARNYWSAPHTGTKRSDKLFRGLPGEDKRLYSRATWEENAEASRIDIGHAYDALEAARIRYSALRERAGLAQEEILLNLDFLHLFDHPQYLYERDGSPETDKAPINTDVAYDPKWSAGHKRLYLYEQIKRLAGDVPALRKYRVNAYYDEAAWLQAYHRERSYDSEYSYRGAGTKRQPYPYENWKPIPLLEECVRTTPPCPELNLVRLQLAGLYMEAQKPSEASRLTQAVLQAKPDIGTLKAAKALLKVINAPQMDWFAPARKSDDGYERAAMLANAKNSVWARSRNVATMKCALYRVPMEKWVYRSDDYQSLKTPWYVQNLFQEYPRYITEDGSKMDPEAGLVRQGALLLKRWSVPVKYRSLGVPAETEIAIPTQEGGYYILIASVGEKRIAHTLHITGRVILASYSGNSCYAYVTDAKSGKPLANQPVVVAEFEGGRRGTPAGKPLTLRTNAEGRCSWTRNPKRESLCWTLSGHDLAVQSFGEYSEGADSKVQLFGVTDRKVYRPGQKVYYRLVLTKPQERTCLPVAGRKAEVVVRNPNGEEIAHSSATTNEFGSVHGEFVLSPRAALGDYMIALKGGAGENGYQTGVSFKVEEYKKPEFEVKATAEPERVTLGQKGAFKIKVSYYAGGGVPNAKVVYQLLRRTPYGGYEGMNYDWASGRRISRGDPRLTGMLQQGVLYTDAQGEATAAFDTAALLKDRDSLSFMYLNEITLTAQVQDSSRRVIEGRGSVVVESGGGYVSAKLSEEYGRVGSPLIATFSANSGDEKPKAAAGRVTITRLRPNKKQSAVVYQQAISIPKTGEATLRWTPMRGGKYEIKFHAADKRVDTTPQEFFVAGAGLEDDDAGGDLSLMVQKSEYDTERSARLLLATPVKDCWVILFQATQGGGQTSRIVRPKGRFLEWETPVDPDKAGFEIDVVVIREGRSYESSARIAFSNRRFQAKVTVESDGGTYKPGGTAHLKVKARDYAGKPLRTELSLAVTDASLNYFTKAPRSRWRGNESEDESPWSHFTPERDYPVRWQASLNNSEYGEVSYNSENKALFSFDGLPAQAGESVLAWLEKERSRIIAWRMENGKKVPIYATPFARDGAGGGFGGAGGGTGGGAMMGGMADKEQANSGGFGGGGRSVARASVGLALKANNFISMSKSRMANDVDTGAIETDPVQSQSQTAAARLRKRFTDTAFWTPTLLTDAEGNAEVDVVLPENLTRWQVEAGGNAKNGVAGAGNAEFITQKRLQVRLQAPRFLVEKDVVILSAIVQNQYDQSLSATVRLELEGAKPQLVADFLPDASRRLSSAITVPANGEKRVDWAVRVEAPGELRVRMTALASVESDATELVLPVLVHGVEKAQSKSGFLSGASKTTIPITLPALRKPGSSRVVIHLAPSLIGVMLDALPYLADYPYGCVEQTMSRFLPSVIVSKTLQDTGYNLSDLQKRAEALAKRDRANPQPLDPTSPYTYPQTSLTHLPPLVHRYRWENPVFQESRLNEMIQDGWKRIEEMQHSGGGWGWWAGDTPDPYMTSYVLYGLQIAKEAKAKAPEHLLTQGVAYLQSHFFEEKDLNRAAFEARVLTMGDRAAGDAVNKRIAETLYPSRDKMSLYGRALLALALNKTPQADKAKTVLAEIEALLQAESKHGRLIAQPKEPWHWHYNETETLATILQAYVAMQPKAPMAPRIVQELIRTRQNHVWDSTRDTALAVLAIADYVRANRELQATFAVTASLGGVVKTYSVTPETALMSDGQIALGEESLGKGTQSLVLSKTGEGNCYYTVETRYVAEEEPIRAVRGEVQVERRYYRLTPNPDYKPLQEEEDNPLLAGSLSRLELQDDWSLRSEAKQPPYIRTLLLDGSRLDSGDTVEVELYLNSHSPQAYMLFEDVKPAGCEAVLLQSGRQWGSGGTDDWGGWLSYYQEARDQKTALFFDVLPQGKSVVKYQLRAETPGVFRALPAHGYAMYAPSVWALSEEATTRIGEAMR